MKIQIAFLSLTIAILSAQATDLISVGEKFAGVSSAAVIKGSIRRSDNSASSFSVALKESGRQSAPCEANDITCWCMKAVKYTNDVRRQAGVKPLKLGSESQLSNAKRWAEKLASMQQLDHQDFRTASGEIGCGRSINGENVAYNYESGDVARACIDQWINSRGHYENMVNDWFLEVVVGIAYDTRGAVFCVQTFAVTDDGNGKADGRGCGRVDSADVAIQTPEPIPAPVSETPTATPTPTPMPSPTPEFVSDSSDQPKETKGKKKDRKRDGREQERDEPTPDMTPSAGPSPNPTPDSLMFSGECERNDLTCWCMKAVKYTNDVRRRAGGRQMLKIGSESQLANANKFAAKLAREQILDHQDFNSANREIGCGRRLGGENVAYNYESGDVARACIDQWIKSRGHYENLVGEWFEEVVVGVAFDRWGAVFCVQTFAVTDGSSEWLGDQECQAVSAGAEMIETPAPPPEPVSVPLPQPTFEPAAEPVQKPVETPTTDVAQTPSPSPDAKPKTSAGKCEKNDTRCWCMKAVKYTNDVRRENGVGMLKVGTESQLANADRWAKELARRENLDHQDFGGANGEIQCGRAVWGENIAYNYEGGDIARACLDQWINSKGHFKNLIEESFEEVVVGFAFDSRGAVFCVQTFVVMNDENGRSDGSRCGRVQM